MKQDIRDLFEKDTLSKKKLPTSHEQDFLRKLKRTDPLQSRKKKIGSFLKVAATIALMISVGYYINKEHIEKTALEIHLEQIEKECLTSIDREWEALKEATNDQRLIRKYEEKLETLAISYQVISKEFSEDPNNISVLESLVENLQSRLQLLKNIKQHVKELHQKNKSNETIYI